MNPRQEIHIVENLRQRKRIVDYCGSIFPVLGSKSATKKALKEKRIFLNDQQANAADFVKEGDRIRLVVPSSRIKRLAIDIPIVYEDTFLLVVNKPGGIATNGNRYKTLENVFAHHLSGFQVSDSLGRPRAVHRIDVPTKGLVVLAKTKKAQIEMSRAFQYNRIEKTYRAIVHGKTSQEGQLDAPIDGKYALTRFRTQRTVRSRVFDYLSLIELYPQTGRTHQLRIHMKAMGHLILGDKLYADHQTILGKGLYLQASGLKFKHPLTHDELILELPVPAKFEKVLQREADRYKSFR